MRSTASKIEQQWQWMQIKKYNWKCSAVCPKSLSHTVGTRRENEWSAYWGSHSSVAENSGQLECHSLSNDRYRSFERYEFLLISSNYQSMYQSTVRTVVSTTEQRQKVTIFNTVIPSQKTSILKTTVSSQKSSILKTTLSSQKIANFNTTVPTQKTQIFKSTYVIHSPSTQQNLLHCSPTVFNTIQFRYCIQPNFFRKLFFSFQK